jgi:hypothetical protein
MRTPSTVLLVPVAVEGSLSVGHLMSFAHKAAANMNATINPTVKTEIFFVFIVLSFVLVFFVNLVKTFVVKILYLFYLLYFAGTGSSALPAAS